MKRFLMFLVFVSAFFAFAACGSAEQRSESRPAQSGGADRPAWTNVAEKIEKNDVVLWIGEASNASNRDDAKNLAVQNAFAKVSNSFGVAVKSEFNSHEVEKDGEYHYAIGVTSSVTGKQIEVKKYHIKDEYIERSGRNHNAFVLVSIPKTELARIKIEVDGFGLWAMKSDLHEAAGEIRKLFPVFNKKGVKLNQQIDFEDSDDIEQLFLSYHKAFLFRIVCDEIKAEEYNGEFYFVVKIKAELFNLMTSETINHWEVESKGAAYSAKEARENAVSKAVQEIADAL